MIQKYLSLALVFGLICFGSNGVRAMTIKEAYEAIPHRQTSYNPLQSVAPYVEQANLSRLFSLTDEAMRLRVSILYDLNTDQDVDLNMMNSVYDSILSHIKSLHVTKDADEAIDLIYQAIIEQREFLTEWAKADKAKRNVYKRYNNHPAVQRSHQKLLQAYNILMKSYPTETAHNKQAFFDHLCALDFL